MIVILHQGPPVATVSRAAAVGEVFADQAPLDRSPRNSFRPDVTRLFPESPCRWLHPYLGRLAPSSFCRSGFFSISRRIRTSAGVTPRPLRRMLQATMRNSIGLRSTPFASFSRPPLCNDIRLVETYPDSRNRRRPLLINARPATRTQK